VRQGHAVYDTDTHIEASAETLEEFLSPRLRQLLPERQQYWVPRRTRGYDNIREQRHSYRFARPAYSGGWGEDAPRYLGEAGPRQDARRQESKFQGSRYPTDGGEDWDPQARLGDMDAEGIDIALMVPGVTSGSGDREADIEFVRATHRYLDNFCGAPARLKSLIVANAGFVDESVAEIKRWARSRWASGVYVRLPLDYPLDHPDLHPIWQAADSEGLAIVHHSFSTGYPGYRDLWNNPFLGRAASHPWGAMRAIGSLFGAGIMDRYGGLKFVILESGFGWLPFWARRLDDQVEYMGYVAEGLQHTMTQYMTSGRFFASIVLHEGGGMVKLVSDYLSDGLLMFSTDYPHPETRFPDSVDLLLSWPQLSADLRRKVLWDNAVRCFGEPRGIVTE